MKIKTCILLIYIVLAVISCKSDVKTDQSDTKVEHVSDTKNEATNSKPSAQPQQFEVRHKNKSEQNSATSDAMKKKMALAKEMEQKSNETTTKTRKTTKTTNNPQKVKDENFPNTMRLVSLESIEKAFNIEPGRLQKRNQSHNVGSGISKSLWAWNQSNGESNKLNVIVVRNPSPDTYMDWSSSTLDRYINSGLKTNDGSVMEYIEIKENGYRYAFNPDMNMLKWFKDESFSISLSGFGSSFDQKGMMNLARDINNRIEKYAKK